MRKPYRIWLPILLVSLATVTGNAQSFRVQCPNTTITPAQKRDIIDYVTRLRAEPNPGGFSLGRIGPVTEGIVGFLGGIGVLVFLAMWITMKRRES